MRFSSKSGENIGCYHARCRFSGKLFHFQPPEAFFSLLRVVAPHPLYFLFSNIFLEDTNPLGGSVSNSPISTNAGFPGPLTYSTRFVIPLSIRLLRISARDLPHEASFDKKCSKTLFFEPSCVCRQFQIYFWKTDTWIFAEIFGKVFGTILGKYLENIEKTLGEILEEHLGQFWQIRRRMHTNFPTWAPWAPMGPGPGPRAQLLPGGRADGRVRRTFGGRAGGRGRSWARGPSPGPMGAHGAPVGKLVCILLRICQNCPKCSSNISPRVFSKYIPDIFPKLSQRLPQCFPNMFLNICSICSKYSPILFFEKSLILN